jgi:O-antigen/teichoic acid export membrane protein
MRILAHLRSASFHTIITNATSLMGATVITAGLGFVYWWVAAHLFVANTVGLASATISAMMLLGTIATLGLGTLLISELPRQPERRDELITTALVIAAATGTGLGFLFVLVAPLISPEFRPLTQSISAIALFALGVGLTTMSFVFDQAMVGLLRGSVQLWRNGIFSVVKLILLVLIGVWLTGPGGMTIYATWALSNLLSLICMVGILAWHGVNIKLQLPQWALLRQLSKATMEHHLLNLALQISGLGMPLVVTALFSAALNASFYMAWLLLALVFVVPFSLTIVLFAAGAADPAALSSKVRLTLSLAFSIGLITNAIIWLGADMILGVFGPTYAEQASWVLRLLALGVFPIIIKDHFVAIRRVEGNIVGTGLAILLAGLFELASASVGGAVFGTLEGLAIGWLVALGIEATLLFRTVFGTVFPMPMRTVPFS